MTRVDFYVLETDDDLARLRFTCRLTEKVFNLGQRVYLHTPDSGVARKLDDLLWTYKAGAFVPHSEISAATDESIVIGHDGEPGDGGWDVLVNLATEVPEFFSRYHRLAEVVDKNASRRQAGRERFRFYRERGYEVHTHNV